MSAFNDSVTINEDAANASGNVQSNDNGQQNTSNGDTRWIKLGGSAGAQSDYTVVTSGGTTIVGTYGTLVIKSDGSYTYTPLASAQSLDTGQSGTDTFRYIAGSSSSFSSVFNDAANITFTVTGVNDAPVANNDTATTNEDNAVLIDVRANDSDVDDALANPIVVSGPAHGSLSLNSVTGKFTYTPNANYNGADSFTYKLNDGTVDSAAATVSITVTSVDDPITGAAPATLTAVNENTVRTITAAELLGTLADVDGALSVSNLTISSGNGSLSGAGPWTYTPAANDSSSVTFSYKITGGGNNIDRSVTMDLIQVNSAPTDIGLSNGSVAENATGALVGLLSATDAQGGAMTYTITDAGSPFEIANGNELRVKAGTALNYEATSSYTVNVQVKDSGNLTFSKGLTVTVSDVNEAPTAVSLTGVTSTLAENTSTASAIKVADIAVTDDALGTETITLSGADAASFEVVGNALYLKAGTALNFEAKSSYAVSVDVKDAALGSSISTGYNLAVSDVNEAPTAVSLSGVTSTLAENTSTASAIKVADINVTDDALGANTITLSGADAASFQVIGNALYLKAGAALNFEAKSSYAVTVDVKDAALGSTISTNYSLAVTDVNEAPTAVSLTGVTSTLAENTSTVGGLKVADINVTDDALGANTIGLSGADAASFQVIGNALYLKAGTALDFEGKKTFSVSVDVKDAALGSSISTNYSLAVTDVNDNAPVFTSTAAPSVAENLKAVVNLTSTDVDTVGGPVTYSITGGADAAKFTIVAGQLQFISAPDYETQAHSYSVQVTANDGVNNTVQNLTVSVTDTNDVTPVINSGASASFAENASGTVYTVTATDGDSTPAFKVISYSLAAGGDNDLFNINSTTGAVTFKASPNFEAPLDSDKNNSYVLTVRASDGVNVGNKTVTVNVTDLVEDSGSTNTAGLTITSTNATIKDASPLILGSANSAQVGQTVTVFEGTTARGTGVVQANGTWSVETGLVADGAHTYTAQIGSSASNSVTLTIDTVAPVVTITGTTGTGFVPTVAGTASTADIGRTVSILDGSTVVGTGTVGAGGAFSVTTGLTGTGAHSLTAQVTDLAGNVGTSAATAYTIAPQPAQGDIDAGNLKIAYDNIMDGPASTQAEGAYLQDLLNKLSLNLVSYKEALDSVIDHADGTTSVATLSYQFFTGKVPTKAGLDYLVSTTGGNANNINSAYYQSFSIENRYINFAVNLGHDGAGKADFQTKYGALSLFDATKKAYAEIFGTAATDAKVHELLDTSVVLGGKAMARSAYFTAYGHDDVGTKAAMVGWLLSEAAKSDVGTYAKANEAFLADLADGATFGVDLVGVYGVHSAPVELLG